MGINQISITEDRAAGGKELGGSLWFRNEDNEYEHLERTVTTASPGAMWTYSVWIKRNDVYGQSGQSKQTLMSAESGGSNKSFIRYNNDAGADTLRFYDASTGICDLVTVSNYRDTNDWIHYVLAVDTTLNTSGNRVKFYTNGQLYEGAYWSSGNTTSDHFEEWNWFKTSVTQYIGKSTTDASSYNTFRGGMSDVYLIDGIQLGPEHFGYTDPLTNIWRPKKFTRWDSDDGYKSNWSEMWDGTFDSDYRVTNGGSFNGTTTGYTQNESSAEIHWIPSSPISISSSLQVYVTQGVSGQLELNDSVVATTNNDWTEIATSGTLTKLSLISGSGSQWVQLKAVKVDGVILDDSAGRNSFHLPMDGKHPIGADQSGKGNDWTPKYFGGSASLDKATGAFPILNTTSGGRVRVPGVRGSVGVAVTVYNDGSGNKYYLDGEQAGTVSFIPGQTVTFNTSDTTNSGHPFRLSGLSDGTHHSTTLYSVSLDGTDDGLKSDNDSSDYYFDGDFTLEYFCYPDVDPDGDVTIEYGHIAAGGSANAWQVYHSNYVPRLWTSTANVAGTVSMTQSVWNHVVFCRKGSTLMSFVNGQSSVCASGYPSSIGGADSSNTLNIGFQYNLGPKQWFDGKISNVRIVKGTCLYTQDFAPPAVPLANVSGTTVLCCQSSSVTDATVLPSGHSLATEGSPASSTDAPQTFTSGVVTGAAEASAGAATTITIPSDIQTDTLYYYCSNHSGMGGAISIGASDPNTVDPYAWKNVLALPLDVDEGRDYSNLVNCVTAQKSLTWTSISNQAKSNFYGQSCQFGTSTGQNHAVVVATDSDFTLGTAPFTIECWIYSTTSSGTQNIVQIYQDGSAYYGMGIWSGYLDMYMDGGTANNLGTAVPGNNKWTHLAYVRDGEGNIYCFVNGVNQVSGVTDFTDLSDASYVVYVGRHSPTNNAFVGYMQGFQMYNGIAKYTEDFIPASTDPDIMLDTPFGVSYQTDYPEPTSGSVLFDGTGDYLSLASSSDTTLGGVDFTMECWVYFTGTGTDVFFENDTGTGGCSIQINGSNLLSVQVGATNITSTNALSTNSWYHLCVQRDHSESTTYAYVDGVQVNTTGTDSGSSTSAVTIGGRSGGSFLTTGNISNARIVKGSVVYAVGGFTPPTSPLTNITNTKLLCCQNKNDATTYTVSPGSITANGDAVASPFNSFDRESKFTLGKESGYATWNPLASRHICRKGNLKLDFADASTTYSAAVTDLMMPPNSGGWYYEYTVDYQTGSSPALGLHSMIDGRFIWGGSAPWYFGSGDSANNDFVNAGVTTANSGIRVENPASTGQTVSVRYDATNRAFGYSLEGGPWVITTYASNDSHKIHMYENTWYSFVAADVSNDDVIMNANFGQKPFKYPPPEGFRALCRTNLPRPGVNDPQTVVGITSYTGDMTAAQPISGFKFAPDLVLLKASTDGYAWRMGGPVLGVGNALGPNVQDDMVVEADGFVSFDESGFTLGSNTGTSDTYHNTGDKYVAFTWKAGGSKGTWNIDGTSFASASAAGLDGGTIDPTYASVGTKQGFGIYKYTGNGTSGADIVHGLSQAPDLIIAKNLGENSTQWLTSHRSAGLTGDNISGTSVPEWYELYLNGETARANNSTDVAAPDGATKITLGSGDNINKNTISYIMLAWHNVTGVQKFGTYIGSGAVSSGPYVYLGFKPAFVIIKNASASGGWRVFDNQNNTSNWEYGSNTCFAIESVDAVTSYSDRGVDLLADGFKLRSTSSWNNTDGSIYLYMAWADSNVMFGGQSNAR